MHLVRYSSASGFGTEIRLSDGDICIFIRVCVGVGAFVDTSVVNVTLTVAITLAVVPGVMPCGPDPETVANHAFPVPGIPLLALRILHSGKRSFVLLFHRCAAKPTT